ncbi:hypothetical protein FACS1894140_4940 [Spirochaetia bacterium]|nr:hypothetical protein FACS1894140_4940 [Spirochaetia bacterium]
MDISVFLDDVKLNIRTAVIIETENGYIFEKDRKYGFYVIAGGRIKINESSEDAAKREMYEELGIKIEKIKLKSIVESFFVYDNKKYHEICFYYNYKTNEKINMPDGFFIINKEEMKQKEIQPKILHKIINSENKEILHFIINE